VYQREDAAGVVGVELNRDLVKVAGRAMERNLTKLGPLVLPLAEKARFAADLAARKLLGLKRKPYVPDFRRAFDHFCLHAGANPKPNPTPLGLPQGARPCVMRSARAGGRLGACMVRSCGVCEGHAPVAWAEVWQAVQVSLLCLVQPRRAAWWLSAARAGRAGGRGVIEGLGKQLNLDRRQVEPSFNSLYWCVPARRPPMPDAAFRVSSDHAMQLRSILVPLCCRQKFLL